MAKNDRKSKIKLMHSPSEQTKIELNLDDIVRENLETINKIEIAAKSNKSQADKLAENISAFCGSIQFVYVHCIVFTLWMTWNSLPIIKPQYRIDPPPFSYFTLVLSAEAIFLSSFILMSQNRQQRISDQRNHLDLQINMLAEQENSQMLVMMRELMIHLGMNKSEITSEALEQPTDALRIAENIEKVIMEDIAESAELELNS